MSLSKPTSSYAYDPDNDKRAWSIQEAYDKIKKLIDTQSRKVRSLLYFVIDCRTSSLVNVGVVDASSNLLFYALLLRMGIKLNKVIELYRRQKTTGKRDFTARYLISQNKYEPDYDGTVMFLRQNSGTLVLLNCFYLFVYLSLFVCFLFF